jgi:tRNA pseudouridine55 synthase
MISESLINREALISGCILPISKPYTWTSFDVVGKLRVMIRRTLAVDKIKVGHAGTLDPLATGLLLVCTGRMTKEIERLQGMPKTYTGDIVLGATTPSFDKETEIDARFPVHHIGLPDIKRIEDEFTGELSQVPPVYSAIKIDGKRAYDYARKNQEVILKPRDVTIYELQLDATDFPILHFSVICSKGTYIRSLARDIGFALGSGAYLENLCRTGIGKYTLGQSFTLEEMQKMLEKVV